MAIKTVKCCCGILPDTKAALLHKRPFCIREHSAGSWECLAPQVHPGHLIRLAKPISLNFFSLYSSFYVDRIKTWTMDISGSVLLSDWGPGSSVHSTHSLQQTLIFLTLNPGSHCKIENISHQLLQRHWMLVAIVDISITHTFTFTFNQEHVDC